MTFGDRLSRLRKENNYTQEQLAQLLGVSRQAISKWESGLTYPETEKLIRMSDLLGCSLDYLIRDEGEPAPSFQAAQAATPLKRIVRERKSQRTLWGLPLWHIGKNARGIVAVGLNARGLIAVGLKARGLVSVGLLSLGVVSFGCLGLGVLSFGLLALGLLSAGCFSVGILTAGAISLGVFSLGAISVGEFSVGALAVGKYAALGDHASAMVAIGETQAVGSRFQNLGALTDQQAAEVKRLLDAIVPACFSWAKTLFRHFL